MKRRVEVNLCLASRKNLFVAKKASSASNPSALFPGWVCTRAFKGPCVLTNVRVCGEANNPLHNQQQQKKKQKEVPQKREEEMRKWMLMKMKTHMTFSRSLVWEKSRRAQKVCSDVVILWLGCWVVVSCWVGL